jgi:uncharacterized protein GlcG (DUF336 family)
MSVTLADAKRVIEAGEQKAAEIGQPMNIAVADAGGNLVAHVRMDGAWIGSIDISQKTCVQRRQDHDVCWGRAIEEEGGQVVGAVEVSGGSGQQDHAVAAAAAEAGPSVNMYAHAPYTTISRAVHIHPTISELIPTLLQDLKPLD